MNGPNVNSLFSCFAESTSLLGWGKTLKAFIFSLKNSEGLPPFKCLAKTKYTAIFKSTSYGPIFGEYPGLHISHSFSDGRAAAKATISEPYIVPTEVNNTYKVLAGTTGYFYPDNYEVFYLA